ncbi:hypothetical protein BD769DRAFT_1664859 [Suillus cothurnatus]|nr:hypothetical protein BD769DRAFT_1664859 [Suillus cothurnatus]
MAEQMTRLQQEISFLQRKSKKARAEMDSNPKPERLIAKPPGAAGNRNGYQVREAMGLGDDKRQYNALMYLDLDKTRRGQDDNEIALVVMKAQNRHPFLRKFRNAWPVRDWIQQFLRNHVNDHRHRLGQGNKVWGYADDEESEELDDDEDEDQDEHEDQDTDEDHDPGEHTLFSFQAFEVMVASGDVGFDDIIMKIMWKPALQACDDLASQAMPQVKGKVNGKDTTQIVRALT